jgi:glycosyltransferase involved in cell wall biosynthesis
VASPVGVNKEIIQDGENGFLASSYNEWLEKLILLVQNEDLRRKLGQKGRETVENRYSLKLWGPKVARFYKSLQ